jgi:DNA polymerase
VPPRGPHPARIVIVGEAPGETEEIGRAPFLGAAGQEMTRMLHEAGFDESQCYITNVFKVRPHQNKIEEFVIKTKTPPNNQWVPYLGRWVNPEVYWHIEDLYQEILKVNPTLIIAFGDTATWALTGKDKITQWGGSVLESTVVHSDRIFKVIPTYHPAAILKMWEWRYVAVQDLRRANREAAYPQVKYPNWNFTLRPTAQQVWDWYKDMRGRLAAAEYHSSAEIELAVDIETRNGEIACIGIADSHLDAICIPFLCVENPEGYWDAATECQIVQLLKDILTDPRVAVVGQYFTFDAQYIARQWGFVPNVKYDTMIMQHTAFPGLPKKLDFLSRMYCNFHQYWKDDGKFWDPKKTPEDQLWLYNCRDAVATWEVAHHLATVLNKLNLTKVYEFQQSLFMPVFKMMLRGVRIDHKLREEFSITLIEEYAKRHSFINEATGLDLNIRSSKQLVDFFYNDLGIKPVKKKDKQTGLMKVTVDDDALNKIPKREILMTPICKAIQEMRTLGVYNSTFVRARYDSDKRMRCSFNIAGTTTFRFSSSEDAFGFGMNLQNVPPEDKETKKKEKINAEARAKGLPEPEFILPNIRRLFIPDEGYYILDWDLDRADLQVVVKEAKDEDLMLLMREGIDMHLANAQVLFKLPYTIDDLRDPQFVERASKEYYWQRQMSKIFVHGTNYGGSHRTMARHCEISEADAFAMQQRWFEAHPGIKEWHARTEYQLMQDRTVSNALGYKRFFFERIEGILPEALAWIPQSTVACVINRGLKNIDDNLSKNVELLLQVHDSLVMQAPVELVTRTKLLSQIKEQLTIEIPYETPLIIPVNCKMSDKSWGDVKSVDIEKWEARIAA